MVDLLAEYKDMAKRHGMFRGLTLLDHADEISKIIERHRTKTLLDWGSGAGDAYRSPHFVHERWGLNKVFIRLYDPSFRHLSNPVVPTAKFDGVICSDVLEHIPESSLPSVLTRLFGHARHFVWASVCCRPAKKCFSDGTNLHVTLHDMAWWHEQFSAHAKRTNVAYYLTETL